MSNHSFEESFLKPAPQKILPSYTEQHKVLILAGPTAVGKSDLAVTIAEQVGGEVISADSMQVYRGMDIGTAKIRRDETRGIPHHLIDIRDITETFNVVDFVEAAEAACEDIISRGKKPIIAGGTGFYLNGLIYGPPEGPPASAPIRQRLEHEMACHGPEALYQKVCTLDEEYGATIGKGDRQKIIRALEIMSLTGKKVSSFTSFRSVSKPSKYAYLPVFLYKPKEILYSQIDHRCDRMIEKGFPEEVERLEKMGLRENLSASQAIGYRQYLQYLDSEQTDADWDFFVEKFKQSSRRYAKRQFTWFRGESDFEWIDMDTHEKELVADMLSQRITDA